MKKSSVVVQPVLPGIDEVPKEKSPRRARPATRVWQDPAVVESRAQADRRYAEWRGSFAVFVAGLPAARRAELRRQLSAPGGRRRSAA